MTDDLTVAKLLVADQQIAIVRMDAQLARAYFLAPDGNFIHGKCGEPGIEIVLPEEGKDAQIALPYFRQKCSCISSE